MEQFSQQVNFYREEFRKKRIFLSSVQMLMVLGGAVFIFILLSIVQATMLKGLAASANIAVGQQQRMSEQLAMLESSFVEPKKDPRLLQQIETIDEIIKRKNTLVSFLGGQSKKKNFSFSGVMNGLAEKSLSGVWLTELSIKTEGNHYRLVGNTQHPDLIPKYIEQLKTSDILLGTSFNLFDLERAKEGESYLKFILSSEGEVSGSEITSR